VNVFELIGNGPFKMFATESSKDVVKIVDELSETCDGITMYQVIPEPGKYVYHDIGTIIHEGQRRFNFVKEELDSLPDWYIFILTRLQHGSLILPYKACSV
jgi:hypothetical protein